jgi:hypothetical protein
MKKTTTVRSVLFALLFTVTTLGFAPNALAESDKKKAQTLFEKGAALYYDGAYAEALVQFKKGHATVPNALFLYNMTLCNLKLQRYREAMSNAVEARHMGGLPDKEATRNEARIAAISAIELSQEVAEAAEEPMVADTAPDTTESPDLSVQKSDAPKKGLTALGWSGVAGLVIGGGLLGGAVATELALQKKWEEFTGLSEGGDPERFEELRTEIERGQQRGKILLYSGTGVAVVGAALLIVDLATKPKEEERPRVMLHVAPGGGVSASMSLAF